MNTRPGKPERLDDVRERSSAQSRRMVDGVEGGRENGIRGREKCLRSVRRWRRRENRRGHDEARPAEQTDTGGGPMMGVGGLLYRNLLAAVGTPQSVESALSSTGKQQEQRDDPNHTHIMFPNRPHHYSAIGSDISKTRHRSVPFGLTTNSPQRPTSTRKKVAGIEVLPSVLRFCAFASSRSWLLSSSICPVF